jgi:hypothetical protein
MLFKLWGFKKTDSVIVSEILGTFLRKMGYSTPDIDSTNEKLEMAMSVEMNIRNICCPQLEKTLHLAASSAEVCLLFYSYFSDFFDHWYTAVLSQL